jgi:acyl carrier protein
LKPEDRQQYLITTLSEQLGRQRSDIHLETDLRKDLEMDGLDMIEMCFDIQDTFGIEISNNEVNKVNTPRDFLRLIEDKVQVNHLARDCDLASQFSELIKTFGITYMTVVASMGENAPFSLVLDSGKISIQPFISDFKPTKKSSRVL